MDRPWDKLVIRDHARERQVSDLRGRSPFCSNRPLNEQP